MFVDTGLLHSGADESRHAGEHAQDGAEKLSRGPLLSAMFDEFPAAEALFGAAASAQMDTRNAGKLRAVRCSSAM